MPPAWSSAHDATDAAWILCTIYAESKGNVPGDLLGYYLTSLRQAPPVIAAAFYDYLSNACPRLAALFAWAK